MYGYVYAPAAATWPQSKCELKRGAAADGKSIAEKHAEIVQQFQRIANTKAQLGLSGESITKLESAFFSTYKKATSGYWGGGLWDGCYRYGSNRHRQGLYFLVAEQLNDRNIDRLTPSARRFSLILGHLAQALRKEEEILRKCAEMTVRSTALRRMTFEDIDAERAEYAKIGAECADVLAEIEQCLASVRETIGRGSKEVWPEKKHYGKRFAISALLYGVAGGIAIAALLVSSGVLVIVGLALTMVIRAVSLGSIRGFDRERGWKSIESLLASTKQLIETEGATMRAYLDISDRRAALAREDMVWNMLKDMRTQTSDLNGRVNTMAEQVRSVASGVDSLTGDVRLQSRALGAFGQRLDSLQEGFEHQSRTIGSIQEGVEQQSRTMGSIQKSVEQQSRKVSSLQESVEQQSRAMGSIRDSVEQQSRTMNSLQESVAQQARAMDALRGNVAEQSRTIGSLQGNVEQQSRAQEALTKRFSGVESKIDDFRRDLQRLSRVPEAARAQLALPMPATFAPQAPDPSRQAPQRANSWSPYVHGNARRV
jgi:archaellum component FlaC